MSAALGQSGLLLALAMLSLLGSLGLVSQSRLLDLETPAPGSLSAILREELGGFMAGLLRWPDRTETRRILSGFLLAFAVSAAGLLFGMSFLAAAICCIAMLIGLGDARYRVIFDLHLAVLALLMSAAALSAGITLPVALAMLAAGLAAYRLVGALLPAGDAKLAALTLPWYGYRFIFFPETGLALPFPQIIATLLLLVLGFAAAEGQLLLDRKRALRKRPDDVHPVTEGSPFGFIFCALALGAEWLRIW